MWLLPLGPGPEGVQLGDAGTAPRLWPLSGVPAAPWSPPHGDKGAERPGAQVLVPLSLGGGIIKTGCFQPHQLSCVCAFQVDIRFPQSGAPDPNCVTVTGLPENVEEAIDHILNLEEEYVSPGVTGAMLGGF